MDPRDVYARELSPFNGHAVLNPRREWLRSHKGLRPAIDVGDVVYDQRGQLVRLFNCLKKEEDQLKDDPDCVFPDDFQRLVSAESSNAVDVPIRVTEGFTRPQAYASKGVSAKKVELDVSAECVCHHYIYIVH